MMITFSTGSVTSLSIAWAWARGLGCPPPRHRAAQLQVRHRARQRGQPERYGTIREHGDDRDLDRDPEGGERADHPAVDTADPTRQRERVGEHSDEVGHHDHGLWRGVAERVKARP